MVHCTIALSGSQYFVAVYNDGKQVKGQYFTEVKEAMEFIDYHLWQI
jgi:hypothetical protein